MNAATRELERCTWSKGHPLLVSYHDEEWGVPVHDDRHWFEKIVLDGAQAGLSWLTILKKRDAYRAAFANFDVQRVARFGERDVARLLADPGIVRNRLKIQSAIKNAHGFIAIQTQFGSFDDYIWRFVDGVPVQSRIGAKGPWPARTELSDLVSKDLKKRGFNFVGTTIVYAFLQAAGVVNDHLVTCFRHEPVAKLGKKPKSSAKSPESGHATAGATKKATGAAKSATGAVKKAKPRA
jgi:DNA-3-methyladenine glycosylase I